MPDALALARKLEYQLDQRWSTRMGICDAYYEGDHTLTFATAKFREAFGSMFGALADNWMQIVVDATAERLKVQGFRFGKEQSADEAAWDIWQANDLDAESNMLQSEAIKLGEAYWLVEPPARGSSDPPRITAEHPSQMIVACAPGDRNTRTAAFKKWLGDDGFAYGTLYLPDQIVKYQSVAKLSGAGRSGGKINWVSRGGDPGGANPLAEVPVVPLRNNPSMLLGGRSDITVGAISIQNAINKLLCDMLIGSEYQAFPQRVLLGVEQLMDENGQPISAYKASQQRLWTFPEPDSKVAEFSAADLGNYTGASQHLVRHLTAQTRTPPHYVLGEIVNASGDALKAAETGLVAKTDDKKPDLGGGHVTMTRLSFKAIGDNERAAVTNAATIWKDTESRSRAETVDAATKEAALGIPLPIVLERIGYSPQEIDRVMAMRETDALLNATVEPPMNGQVPPAQQVVASAGQ